jgi:3-methylfumaryl-CoA hydratase
VTAAVDNAALQGWVGRSESRGDMVTPQIVAAFRATVADDDRPVVAGEPAPPGIHWCLAPATPPMRMLGPDGHPARGGFLPPVPLPRRMWAGSRIVFAAPLRVGDAVDRLSVVKSVEAKTGASGPLVFVTVEHTFRSARGVAVREEQDLVYRDAPSGSPATASAKLAAGAAPDPERTRWIDPTPTLLFRFSALTFNGHRIHYDRPYATEVEGYPGLVVHGPLQAALLLDLATAMQDGAAPAAFEFRARRPLFDGRPFFVNGCRVDASTIELWSGADAAASVTATARW